MKRILVFVIAAICGLHASAQVKDWAYFGKYEKSNQEITTTPKVVFMGDSITELWERNDSKFFTDNNFLCRGISGQTTSEMLVRFRRDVIELNPKYVVIMAGTNDVAQNNGYISNQNILGNIISMCELAKFHKIKVILCSLMPADRIAWRPEIEPVEPIKQINASIREYAKSHRIPYVDYYSEFVNEKGGLPAEYAPDGVHPTLECYKLMENIILSYIK